MNIIYKITLRTAVLCLGITLNTSCSNNEHKEEDPKEHAEEANEEKFDNKGEKDADRLSEAYMGNLYEIMAAESAASKATTGEVKKLAEMMKTAHTKMGKDLADLASRKSVTLPADLTAEQKRDLDKLNEKTGLDFDKEYADQMKNKHEETIKTFEKISEKAEDADIKQWAANTMPEVQSHLTMIESCQNNLKDMKDNNKDRKGDKHDDEHKDKDHTKH